MQRKSDSKAMKRREYVISIVIFLAKVLSNLAVVVLIVVSISVIVSSMNLCKYSFNYPRQKIDFDLQSNTTPSTQFEIVA